MNTGVCEQGGGHVCRRDFLPHDHTLQVYSDDDVLVATLERFVTDGFRAGESVIVIATMPHLYLLERQLLEQGFNLSALHARGRYIRRNAHEALSRFLVGGRPDEALFAEFAATVMGAAAKGAQGGRVRAFGEMVAILWDKGNASATIELERLWEAFCRVNELSLLCAYPEASISSGDQDIAKEIFAAHTHIMPN